LPVRTGIFLGFVIFNKFKTNTADSVVLIFDDIIKITLNKFCSKNKDKSIAFENLKNILNGDLYKVLQACDNKHDVTYRYAYYFTEQDYLDALKLQ
jgi:hypothetical protein